MDEQFVPSFMGGRLLLQSLELFAEMEIASGIAGIGDRFEAGPTLIVNHTSTEDTNPEDMAKLERLGIKIEPGAKWDFQGMQFFQPAPHGLLFCLTDGDPSEHALQFEYGGMVEIFDPAGLAKAIWEEGELDTDAKPAVQDVFRSARFGHVKYGPKLGERLDAINILLADAFTKPDNFAGQKEVRLLLEAKDSLLHDRIFVLVPDMARFARQVEHPGRKAPSGSAFRIGGDRTHTIAEELAELLREAEAFDAESDRLSEVLTAERSAIFDEARVRLGSSQAAAQDLEVQRLSDPIFEKRGQLAIDRMSEFRETFEPRIRQLKWRLRLDEGLKATGIAGHAHNRMSLQFLDEKLRGCFGPGQMYYNPTVHRS